MTGKKDKKKASVVEYVFRRIPTVLFALLILAWLSGNDAFGTNLLLWILVFGCFFIPGIVVLIHVKAYSTQAWSRTQGKIISAELFESTTSSGSTNYGVDLLYEYTVDGKRLEGSNVSTGNPHLISWRKKKVEARLSLYQVGQEVDVFYSADNPADAVLRRGLGLSGCMYAALCFFCLFMLSLGFLGLFGYLE